jgi:hypothetical protein
LIQEECRAVNKTFIQAFIGMAASLFVIKAPFVNYLRIKQIILIASPTV